MVLGMMRSRHNKGASVQLDFIIHVGAVKPWPPSQSFRSVRSVLLVCQHGDRNSGSFLSKAGDADIEFNHTFTLSVTLCPEKKAQDKFQKNFLYLHLYEQPQKDKTSRGQLLGTATINLADFAAVQEGVSTSTPLNSKKTSKNFEQPRLFFSIQPVHKDEQTSVADSVDEGNDEQCEIASFTDDDVCVLPSRGMESPAEASASNAGNHMNSYISLPRLSERSPASVQKKSASPTAEYFFSFASYQSSSWNSTKVMRALEQKHTANEEEVSSSKHLTKIDTQPDNSSCVSNSDAYTGTSLGLDPGISLDLQESQGRKTGHDENEAGRDLHEGGKYSNEKLETKKHVPRDEMHVSLQEYHEKKVQHPESDVVRGKDVKEKLETKQDEGRIPRDDLNVSVQESEKKEMQVCHTESEVVHVDLVGGKDIKVKEETELAEEILVEGINLMTDTEMAAKLHVTEDASSSVNSDQTNKLKSRIEMLEEELRETAAVELSLYSAVAEHSSSSNKVHAPARRLSRFFFLACKDKSQVKRASSARTAVYGLALVSKACGNDVPRLTFWLSNTKMLREIVSQYALETIDKNRPYIGSNTEGRKGVTNEHTNCGDMELFTFALEQIEAWIFSKIVESVWWQIFTPHMQRSVSKTSSRTKGSNSKKRTKLGFEDQEPDSFSIELWKKAFGDACERLCPVRAEGHECGCLPMMAKLVMEQLVSRLDVAMFNAILRESVDEMPTDPVSDPISNPKVLPIRVGKLSFGAGVQLKNAIGNWSRWLSDLFEAGEDGELHDKQQESFRLLNALSDLMMLPFQMLADPLTRKEVCPKFSPSLVKIILSRYVPDEFSPDPVPQEVLQALDSEVESFTSFPCTAAPTVYSSPTAASVARFVGHSGTHPLSRSGSSLLKKSYTSDDELDEVDSPLTCIIADRSLGWPSSTSLNWIPKVKGSPNLIRYQLLQELWRDDDH